MNRFENSVDEFLVQLLKCSEALANNANRNPLFLPDE